jgi:hypothetical protein
LGGLLVHPTCKVDQLLIMPGFFQVEGVNFAHFYHFCAFNLPTSTLLFNFAPPKRWNIHEEK